MRHPAPLRRLALGLALITATLTGTVQAANEQYFPLQSYRVGPYAAGGTGFFGGFIDYLQYINTKGGVNGVKLTWSECETEYVVEKGVECYERLKGGLNGAPAAATNPLSVGIAYATLDRSTADKLPLITINHGRTDSTDGSVFPYVFPLQLNPYSEVSAIINYIGQREGGADKLKGKKIAVLYHGSPYGKETQHCLRIAQHHQAKTLIITDSNLSPLAKRASTVLLVNEGSSFAFRSLSATLCLCQALFIAVAYRLELKVDEIHEQVGFDD